MLTFAGRTVRSSIVLDRYNRYDPPKETVSGFLYLTIAVPVVLRLLRNIILYNT